LIPEHRESNREDFTAQTKETPMAQGRAIEGLRPKSRATAKLRHCPVPAHYHAEGSHPVE